MVYQFFITFSSLLGSFTIVWKEKSSNLLIQRIFLSDPEKKSEKKALDEFKEMENGSSSIIDALGSKIIRFLKGEDVKFDLHLIDLNLCFSTQKKVLLAEFGIPRGSVSTYKRIANKIGIPRGARAVGNALAKNPFPIIIPCHRAIKSNGELGGFQGGIEMKRKLLEMEGREFSDRGKVIMKDVYY